MGLRMSLILDDGDVRLFHGDTRVVMQSLPAESVHCVVTSPPYWNLRNYNVDGQIGLEESPDAFIDALVGVFRDVRRVLRRDGTVFLNLGDSYAGSTNQTAGFGPTSGLSGASSPRYQATMNAGAGTGRAKMAPGLKPKDLVGMPWRVALALQADGWWLRSCIIWSKPNPMPESVTDRPTTAHEYVFLLSKAATYYYDADAVREANQPGRRSAFRSTTYESGRSVANGGELRVDPVTVGGSDPSAGRNLRSVWSIATEPTPEAHFATFPQALVEPCVKAGCPEGGTVLDPFAGSGTTCLVARRLGRNSIGIDLSAEYLEIAKRRIGQPTLWSSPS